MKMILTLTFVLLTLAGCSVEFKAGPSANCPSSTAKAA